MSVDGSGLQRSRTESHLLEWQAQAPSPPHPGRQLVQYGQSAPAFLLQGTAQAEGDDTVAFYAPPLHQETLMEVMFYIIEFIRYSLWKQVYLYQI